MGKAATICKKVTIFGFAACIGLFLAVDGIGNAADNAKAAQKDYIQITSPEANSVVDGYFLAVSWTDSSVEKRNSVYPDNYDKHGGDYNIIVTDESGTTILERKVTGQNYLVFAWDDIKEDLFSEIYLVKVVSRNAESEAVKFYYNKPPCELPNTDHIGMFSTETETAVAGSATMETAAKSTSSGCAYCYSWHWPGTLVILVNATTYTKYINIFCNSIQWSSLSYAPSYSGPIFIPIAGGDNFKITYYDSIYNTYQCTLIKPFQYTVVQFP